MDENNVGETTTLQKSDKLNEEALNIALDINEALASKEKSFKSLKTLPTKINKNFANDISQSGSTNISRVKVTLLNQSNTPLPSTLTKLKSLKETADKTTVKIKTMQAPVIAESLSLIDSEPMSATYSNENITEDQETENATATENQMEFGELTTHEFFATNEANTQNPANNNIELDAEHDGETTEPTSLKENSSIITKSNIKGTGKNSKLTSSHFKAELAKEEIGSSTAYFSEQNTTIPFEISEALKTESLIEISPTKSLTYRPLIRSSTTKPDISTRKYITPFNSLRPVISKLRENDSETNSNVETSQEPNLERSTPRTLLPRNHSEAHNKFKRLRTTTEGLDEMADNISTTRRTYSALIRYRSTPAPTDEEDEQNTESATENVSNIPGGDSEEVTIAENDSEKKSAQTTGSAAILNRKRTSDRYSSVKRRIATDKEDPLTTTFPTSAPHEDISQSTTEEANTTATTVEQNLVNKETSTGNKNLLTSPSFVTLRTSQDLDTSEESSGDNFTTEDIPTDNKTPRLRSYQTISRQTVHATAATLAEADSNKAVNENISASPTTGELLTTTEIADRKISNHKEIINVEELFNEEHSLKTDQLGEFTHLSAADTFAKQSVSDQEPFENSDNYLETTTEISAQEEVIAKVVAPAKNNPGYLNRQETSSETEILQAEGTIRKHESSLINKDSSTRRPYHTFARATTGRSENFDGTTITSLIDIENQTESTTDIYESLAASKLLSTKRTLSVRKPFAGFNRPATTTADSTITKYDEKEKKVIDLSLHARKPFGSFTPTTPSSTHSFGAHKSREEVADIEKSDRENTTNYKHKFPSKRPFNSFTPHTTATQETLTEETDSILDLKEKKSIKHFETPNKLLRKSLIASQHLSATDSHIRKNSTNSGDNTESSTNKNVSNYDLNASVVESTTELANDDDSTYDSSIDFEYEETTKRDKETLNNSTSEEIVLETKTYMTKGLSTPTTIMPTTSEPEKSEDETTDNELSSSRNSTKKTNETLKHAEEGSNSTWINAVENIGNTTKLHLITPDEEILKAIQHSESSTDEQHDLNESGKTINLLLTSNRTHGLYGETSSELVADSRSDIDEEEEIISEANQTTDSTTPRSFSSISRFKTSFEEIEFVNNTSNDSTTQRPSPRVSKFQTTTESSLETATDEQVNENDSTLKKFNRYKTITKSSRVSQSNFRKSSVDSSDNNEVSTQHSLGAFVPSKRINLSSKFQGERATQKSTSNFNRNLYNRKNQQNEEEFREVNENSHPSFINYKKYNVSSETKSLTDTKNILKPFKFNRPQFERTTPQPDNAPNEDEGQYGDGSDEDYSDSSATTESSSTLLTLLDRFRIEQSQDKDSEQHFVTNSNKNFVNSRHRTQTNFNTITSKSSELITGNKGKDMVITKSSITNTNNRFGSNRYNSTVANYLNRTKFNLSQMNTNTASSHINQDNEDRLKIDIDEVDEEDDDDNDTDNDNDNDAKSEVSDSNKSNVNQFNNDVYKADDNDSKRRFQKYQFQRRTTTPTTTTSTSTAASASAADDGVNAATKTQVNLNDAYESERQSSTNIPETTAPITTESFSLPATPLQRRIRVIKLKRPLVSNINNTNTNITVNAIASSATNLNASHTVTQNIVKVNNRELDALNLDKPETLIETVVTRTQTPLPPQTSPPTPPKHIRKVIRKIKRPVNRNTGSTSATEDVQVDESSSKRQNATRFGFNRSTKFEALEDKEIKSIARAENTDELVVKKKEDFSNRGRNRFRLPSGAETLTANSFNGSKNRNGFSSRTQPASTTERSRPVGNNEEDKKVETNKDVEEYETDEEEQEEIEATTILSHPAITGLKDSTPTATTESISDMKKDDNANIDIEPETTMQVDEVTENTTSTDTTEKITEEQTEDSNDRVKTGHDETADDDTPLKLHNKVKPDLAKESQPKEEEEAEEEGILSARFKSNKTGSQKEETESDNPLLKLRNKVQKNLAKNHQVEGVLSDRLKTGKHEPEIEDKEDPLLKLRNKVKQELVKTSQEEGVVSVKLKKLIEANNATSTHTYKVEDGENDTSSTKDSLNLQKIRDKVQTNLAKSDQDEGILNSRINKLLSEKSNSTLLSSHDILRDNESETSTEIKEVSGDGDSLESNISTRKPFVPKAKLSAADNENQNKVSNSFAPKERTTFRRKLVARRPYIPTKSSLNALSTTTIRAPTTKSKSKYVRGKYSGSHALNTNNRYNSENIVRTTPRVNKFLLRNRFKIEGSAGGKNAEEYQESDEEEEEEEEGEVEDGEVEDEAQALTPNPIFIDSPQSRPVANSKDQESGDKEDSNAEEDEEDEDEAYDEIDEEDDAEVQNDKEIQQHPHTYQPKDNRIPPGARPALTTTATNNKPFAPSRVANTPYKPGAITTSTPTSKDNRFGTASKQTAKPRVVNRPLGFAVPNLTIKPVANDFEPTTLLIPTKPAPFINPNTRAYERKYTGTSTEDPSSDSNPLIEDLNIEALNARNKKIFDMNSKKHTTLQPKVLAPLAKPNDSTQELQQETNTEFEDEENESESDYNSFIEDGGYATTTPTTTTNTTNTNTQQQEQQEQKQSTTLETTTIGTQNTDAANQSNANHVNELFSQDGWTTIPPPTTTLLHIFTLSDGEQTTQTPLHDGNQVVPRLIVESIKPKHKVVEISRIVEINSKEEKLRRKSKANTIVAIEGSQTYKVESLPHIEQLGEISVVKYVHQVDGGDITIEGRSTVTDYTPTEAPVSEPSQPLRHSLSEVSSEHRYGKALLPEVIRETETSTISLEGLFETARKGKILNTIDDAQFAKQETNNNKENNDEIKPVTESPDTQNIEKVTEISKDIQLTTESFNIVKSIAFDVAKINWEPDNKEIESNKDIVESTSSPSTTADNTSSTIPNILEIPLVTTTPAPGILNKESTSVAPEDTKVTTVAATLFPQYLRTPATVNNNGVTATRRPVLSVRRRLINSSTAAAAAADTQQTAAPTLTTIFDSSSIINDEYITTSKFKRLRTNRPPALNSAAVDITTDTTAATATAFKTNNKLNRKSTETLSNDLKLASSSLTSSSSDDNDVTAKQTAKAQTSAALRRKFQARRLTTTTASNTNSDGTGTEPPRTQNPLFKRRYSLTTYSPLSVKSGQPSKVALATTSSSSSTLRAAIDSLTTTVYVDGLENEEATDQVAKSSIHTSRFNQINGRLHIDDDDEEESEGGIGNGEKSGGSGGKSLTTLSSATRQPASRFLQQQSPPQLNPNFNYDDVITRRMDGTGIIGKSSTATSTATVSTSTTVTPAPAIKKRKMVIKRKPQKTTPSSEESLGAKRRRPHKYQEPFERINSSQLRSAVKTSTQPGRTYRPNLDYDYYDDEDVRLVGNKSDQQLKVILHGGGIIECLDQGNFPHPLSCRKFISCAKFETGGVVGWEYTCPKGLSYDPVGGMCNWAAGLGCKE